MRGVGVGMEIASHLSSSTIRRCSERKQRISVLYRSNTFQDLLRSGYDSTFVERYDGVARCYDRVRKFVLPSGGTHTQLDIPA